MSKPGSKLNRTRLGRAPAITSGSSVNTTASSRAAVNKVMASRRLGRRLANGINTAPVKGSARDARMACSGVSISETHQSVPQQPQRRCQS
ncbi:MAG: hypothetical protein ACD_23C01317G0001 [uncultured bacterium]|nr:MAG: hypothetical protein ACD_23C01317G0001 [uncultured bacterium]